MQKSTTLSSPKDAFSQYQHGPTLRPLFFCGNALEILGEIPARSIDCCMTSPPYWGQRQYATEGIGLEEDHRQYIADMAAVCREVHRVLQPPSSFWLNVG